MNSKTSATIMVTSGPDRGKLFELSEELVSIGRGVENHVDLTDSALTSHQASIVHRNGRFAIYSPVHDVVQVDGNPIPAERWVWLPETARVQLSNRTSLQFNVAHAAAEPAAPMPAATRPATEPAAPRQPAAAPRAQSATNAPAGATAGGNAEAAQPTAGDAKSAENSSRTAGSRRAARGRGKKTRRRNRETARFITDQVGDPLVELGDDGALPELTLAEGHRAAPQERQQRPANPMVVYLVCGFSVAASLLMLVMDSEVGGRTSASRLREARQEIQQFYGDPEQGLEAYQRHLRAAQRAQSRNDLDEARREYRIVLQLLNSEDNLRGHRGLTGDLRRDDQLRELLGILMAR